VDPDQAGGGWGARADGTRRVIVSRLADGPQAVGQLAAGLPVSRSAVSQHLKVLKDAGLVSERAVGTRRVYRLNPTAVSVEVSSYRLPHAIAMVEPRGERRSAVAGHELAARQQTEGQLGMPTANAAVLGLTLPRRLNVCSGLSLT